MTTATFDTTADTVVETLDPSFGYLVHNTKVGKWQVYTQTFDIVCQGADRAYAQGQVADGCTKAMRYGITDTVPMDFAEFNRRKLEFKISEESGSTAALIGGIALSAVQAPISPYTVAERFELLDQFVEVIAEEKNNTSALVLTGTPGVGKTTAVRQRLTALGLKLDTDLYSETTKDTYRIDCDYTVVGGKISPKGLYQTLFDYNGKLILVDDCDNALSKGCLDLLKCVLDTTGQRIVSWIIDEERESRLPPKFEFTGRVIFISNKNPNDVDKAITSRALMYNIHMTDAEKLERMETILPLIAGYSADVKADAMAYMQELFTKNRRHDLCMRTLVKVLQLRAAKPAKWHMMVNASMVA